MLLIILLILLSVPVIAFYLISYFEYDVEQDSPLMEKLYVLASPLVILAILAHLFIQEEERQVRTKYADVDFASSGANDSSSMQG